MSSTTEQSASPGVSGSDQGQPQQPVTPTERIYSIDVLRGVAVLGILVINIWIFSLPELAYVDVSAEGGDAYLNRATWVISEIVFEGKMRALLSMLFGAGVILLTSRIEARGGNADVTDIYYRRNLWLLAFGVTQAYLLIWVADFIYVYALVGLVLFPFRKMRAETLIVIGLLLLAVLVPKRILHSNHLRSMQTAAVKAEAIMAKSNQEHPAGTRNEANGQVNATSAATEQHPHEEKTKSATEKQDVSRDGQTQQDDEPAKGLNDSAEKETGTANQDTSAADAKEQTLDELESEPLSEDTIVEGKQKPEQGDESKESAEEEDNELREHQQSKKAWDEKLMIFRPTPQQIEEKIEAQRSGYWTVLKKSVPMIVSCQSTVFYLWFFWDVAGMMFIGMGLMKLGVFSAERTTGVYTLLVAGGYGFGLPVSVFATYSIIVDEFDVPELILTCVVYDSARLATALGHVGLVMLVCKAELWQWLTGSLAATGRMALSNYIAQTVICTLLFNGYGFGLYGRPERWHTVLLVIAICLVQLIVSTYWLRVFHCGPMEWLWRTLTYQKWQSVLVVGKPQPEPTVP